MKIKTFLSLFCFTFLINTASLADEIQSDDAVSYGLGLNAGWVVGNGILFRAYDNKQFYQATFVGMIDKDAEEEYLDLSVSYARYLNRFNYGTPIGLKWISGGEIEYDVDHDISDSAVNIGSGIGLDLGHVSKPGVVISMDLIYTLSFKGLKALEFNSLDLRPTLGILYNF